MPRKKEVAGVRVSYGFSPDGTGGRRDLRHTIKKVAKASEGIVAGCRVTGWVEVAERRIAASSSDAMQIVKLKSSDCQLQTD